MSTDDVGPGRGLAAEDRSAAAVEEMVISDLRNITYAREYVEIMRCWNGMAGGGPTIEERFDKTKHAVALRWMKERKLGAGMASDNHEADWLATELTRQINLCESAEELRIHLDQVRDHYTRKRGDKAWWHVFEHRVADIYNERHRQAAARGQKVVSRFVKKTLLASDRGDEIRPEDDVSDKGEEEEGDSINDAADLLETLIPTILVCENIDGLLAVLTIAASSTEKSLDPIFLWVLVAGFLTIMEYAAEVVEDGWQVVPERVKDFRRGLGTGVWDDDAEKRGLVSTYPFLHGSKEIRRLLAKELERYMERLRATMEARQERTEILRPEDTWPSQKKSHNGTLESGDMDEERETPDEAVRLAKHLQPPPVASETVNEENKSVTSPPLNSYSANDDGFRNEAMDVALQAASRLLEQSQKKPDLGDGSAADDENVVKNEANVDASDKKTFENIAETDAQRAVKAAEKRIWDETEGDALIKRFFPREWKLGIWSFKQVPDPPDEDSYRRMFPKKTGLYDDSRYARTPSKSRAPFVSSDKPPPYTPTDKKVDLISRGNGSVDTTSAVAEVIRRAVQSKKPPASGDGRNLIVVQVMSENGPPIPTSTDEEGGNDGLLDASAEAVRRAAIRSGKLPAPGEEMGLIVVPAASDDASSTSTLRDERLEVVASDDGLNDPPASAFMNVYIKTPDQETLALAVRPSEGIGGLKFQIQVITGIPSEQQRLLFGDQQLEDGRVLADYNVNTGSTLQLAIEGSEGEEIPPWDISLEAGVVWLNQPDSM